MDERTLFQSQSSSRTSSSHTLKAHKETFRTDPLRFGRHVACKHLSSTACSNGLRSMVLFDVNEAEGFLLIRSNMTMQIGVLTPVQKILSGTVVDY
uniref:Uncharacterized protein n=1 Tax=Steinernema glaseri TaxID=37863 RepID=A0A1I8A313_9BILA